MRKFLKAVALLLSVSVILPAAGCKKDEGAEGDVKLKWVMAGPGVQNDSTVVWEEFNKKLSEFMPGVSVEFEIFPTSDYSQQFMLMQTAGTTADIASAYLLDFAKEVKNGTFAALDDVSDKLSDAKTEIPDAVWDYMKVDGKLYGVPSYQMLCVEQALVVPAELAEKYLDESRLKAALAKPVLDDELWDVIEDYLEKCESGGELGYGYNWAVTPRTKGYRNNINYTYAISDTDPENKVVNIYTTDNEIAYSRRKAQWYKKGYIRKDALSANDNQNGKAGGYVIWQETASSYAAEKQLSAKYGMPVKTYPFFTEDEWYMPTQYAASGNCVMSSSKYKEKAAELLNLINSEKGKDLYNLLVFGIEGKHYEKEGENRIKVDYQSLPDSSSPYGLYKWIVGNVRNAYEIQSEPEGYNDWIFNVQNAKAVQNIPELMGFRADTSAVNSKIAQIQAVKSEYYPTLLAGATEDVDGLYAEFKDKLDKAGEAAVIEELQKQVDEFLKNK